jgi:hypothetical protein
MSVIQGKLFLFCETGIQGAWAIQDERFISPPTEEWPHESWSYDGLVMLRTGDHLKAFNADGTVYWEGDVVLLKSGNPDWETSTASREVWGKMFIGEMRGEVTRA